MAILQQFLFGSVYVVLKNEGRHYAYRIEGSGQ